VVKRRRREEECL